jgi:hypothetical protein
VTTIAYKDGVLAADTLSTRNGAREGVAIKIFRRGDLLAGASGCSARCKYFRDWFVDGCKGDCPPMGDLEKNWAEGFIIMADGRLVTFGPTASWAEAGMYSDMNAWGSGADFARGAMTAGASAEEAVRIAMHWDTNSGGDITVLRRA